MMSIDVPSAWERAAGESLQLDLHRILVIGTSDSGKSTFCRFLCRYLAGQGESVAMIDADIGQKEIGPPACITLGFPGADGEAAKAAGLYFVGGVNPFGRFLNMAVGVQRLTDSAGAVFRVIDTTGLVQGAGRILKRAKIETLRPDVIVAIQRSAELELLLSANRNCRTMRIPVSVKAISRASDERRRAREAAFSVYFQSAAEIELGIDDLIFQRCRIFNGKPVENPDFIYCEESAEGLLAVTGRKLSETPGLRVMRPGFEENLLCGVADAHGVGSGLAIISGIDFRKRTIRLVSAAKRERIEIIQFGDMYLDANGKALGAIKPGSF